MSDPSVRMAQVVSDLMGHREDLVCCLREIAVAPGVFWGVDLAYVWLNPLGSWRRGREQAACPSGGHSRGHSDNQGGMRVLRGGWYSTYLEGGVCAFAERLGVTPIPVPGVLGNPTVFDLHLEGWGAPNRGQQGCRGAGLGDHHKLGFECIKFEMPISHGQVHPQIRPSGEKSRRESKFGVGST